MINRARLVQTPRRFALLIFVLGAVGCQQTGFQAATLPKQFRADALYPSEGMSLAQLPSSNYRSDTVYPGDVLSVSVATGLEQGVTPQWNVRVSDQGIITLPLVGAVRVGGLPLEMADEAVRNASIQQGVYRHPQVTVRLAQRQTKRVTVIGEVEKPGTYDIPAAGGQLAEALAAAGGFTEEAGTKVELNNSRSSSKVRHASHSGDPIPTTAPQNSVIDLASARTVSDTSVDDGSVVLVKKRDLESASVIGLVKLPKQVELSPEKQTRLLDAISQAGDRTLQFADKVTITRLNPNNGQRIEIHASVKKAKKFAHANLLLAPGDVVSVDETPLTFTVGMLQSFIRFGFSSAIPGF